MTMALHDVCMNCNSPVQRYDRYGIAFCNPCYGIFTDTTKPVDGSYCPSCQRIINKYRQGPDGTWHCSYCHQIYSIAKYVALNGYQTKGRNMTSVQPTATTPITLSHSQLETWQQCQLRWRLTKIDKVTKAPSEALILGTAFHAALEEDGKLLRDNMPPSQDWEMLATFDKTMRGVLAKDDPNNLITKRQQTAMRGKAQLMILKYIDIVQPTFKPISVESSFTFAVSEAVKFTGRIDAVTARGIVDWKTASMPWDKGEADGKDQAAAYFLAMPDAQRMSFAVFSTDGNTATFQSLATERNDERIAAYQKKILDIAQQMQTAKETGKFVANVGSGKDAQGHWLGNCHKCEVLGACTAGQAWLKLKGRTPAVPVIQTMKETQ